MERIVEKILAFTLSVVLIYLCLSIIGLIGMLLYVIVKNILLHVTGC